MNARLMSVLAWTLWALTVATVVLGVVLIAWAHSLAPDQVMTAIAFDAFPLVGALIVSRRPSNAVGWICLAIGLGTATTFLDAGYREYCIKVYGMLTPLSLWLDWVGNCLWPINVALAGMLLLLFPTGGPPTTRWRWVLWALILATVLYAGSSAVLPGNFSGENIANPAGIPELGGVLSAVNNIASLAANLLLLLAACSAILRFLRSRGDEREQMKWFAYGATVLIISAVLSVLFLPEDNNTLLAIGIMLVPLGIGIAVLRYRLYDIDVIIRRTLIYGVLTSLLAALYFAVVLSAQIVGERLTGQTQLPAWVIVVTTLAIAALFTPLRQWVQRTIDRRFYRRRYNATRTVEAFAAALRTELDLSELREHLVGVVDETMRPEHVSLWLRVPRPQVDQVRPDDARP
jgi:hypothetical protein